MPIVARVQRSVPVKSTSLQHPVRDRSPSVTTRSATDRSSSSTARAISIWGSAAKAFAPRHPLDVRRVTRAADALSPRRNAGRRRKADLMGRSSNPDRLVRIARSKDDGRAAPDRRCRASSAVRGLARVESPSAPAARILPFDRNGRRARGAAGGRAQRRIHRRFRMLTNSMVAAPTRRDSWTPFGWAGRPSATAAAPRCVITTMADTGEPDSFDPWRYATYRRRSGELPLRGLRGCRTARRGSRGRSRRDAGEGAEG